MEFVESISAMRMKMERGMKRMKGKITALLLMMLLLVVGSASAAPTGKAHYLLVGVEGWGVSEEREARSDAIMLATLDYDSDRIVLVSFARDSLVRPSYRKGATKLNTLVRATQGDQTLVTYMEEAFGIPIDGYFLVNFSGAVDVLNAIGGVEIELSEEEAQYLLVNAGEEYGYPLHAGPCLLSGGQAFAYMRCRILDNDFGRQHRQSNVLRAAFRKLTTLKALDALALLDDVMGMYRTDMGMIEQMALVKNTLGFRDAAVETHSLPADGTYKYDKDGRGGSGLAFDLEENRRLLWDWLDVTPMLMEPENGR